MGLIHIYCGDGKGKTTAAVGLALRAAGQGMKVHFIQFLKGSETGEINILKHIKGITVARCDRNYGFYNTMSDKDKTEIICCHNNMLSNAIVLANQESIDMLIMDEFNAAYNYGLMDKVTAENFIINKPERLELIITGRNPVEKFMEKADYVSCIKAVKHPYEKGINARKGIEY